MCIFGWLGPKVNNHCNSYNDCNMYLNVCVHLCSNLIEVVLQPPSYGPPHMAPLIWPPLYTCVLQPPSYGPPHTYMCAGPPPPPPPHMVPPSYTRPCVYFFIGGGGGVGLEQDHVHLIPFNEHLLLGNSTSIGTAARNERDDGRQGST